MSLILQECTSAWQTVIARAHEKKREQFGKQAEDAMHFYVSGDHSMLFDQAYMQQSMGMSAQNVTEMNFKTTINLTSNAVSVFLPVLYNRNPNRTVTPKQCEIDQQLMLEVCPNIGVPYDPTKQDQEKKTRQLRAGLFNHYLNATPRELNLKDHARLSILEAFVKGNGVLWAESFPAADGTRLVGLAHDSIDYLNIDPDSESLFDAGFIVRRRCEPIFKIEKKFDLKPGTLKDAGDTFSSHTMTTNIDEEEFVVDSHESKTCDTMTYYEVYSRIGLGSNLKQSTSNHELDELAREVLDQFGDNCYLAIPSKASGYEYPLNLPPELFDEMESDDLLEEVKARIRWPIPAFADRSNPWPCVVLGFHPVPKSPWCKSHMTDTMGLQKCADWILSFLVNRVRITCRSLIVCSRELEEEVVEKILHGGDLELLQIETEHAGTVQQLVDFIRMPEISGDVWKLLMAIKQEIEDNTGVTELNMAARTSQQMRSAAEADLKRDILAVRPDDMANAVENWLAQAGRLEAGAAAATLDQDDIARVFNEPKPSEIAKIAQQVGAVPGQDVPAAGPYTSAWMKLIYDMPVSRIFSELEFSVESGSARKPNQSEKIANVDELGKGLLQFFWQIYQGTGDPSQINEWLMQYARSRNMADPSRIMFPDMRQQMQQQQAAAQGGMPPQLTGPQPSGSPEGMPGGPPSPQQQLPPELMAMIAGGGVPPQGMPMPMDAGMPLQMPVPQGAM